MALYSGICSCGHKESFELSGPASRRKWELSKKLEGLCNNCREEEKVKAHEAALAGAEEMGLPELSGTPKQVRWALTIRHQVISTLDDFIGKSDSLGDKEWAAATMDYIILTHTSAAYCIEKLGNCLFDAAFIMRTYRREVDDFKEKRKLAGVVMDESDMAGVVEETTLYPEEQKHKVPVEIKVSSTSVKAFVPKNEVFRLLVKGLRYRWSPDERCWMREITVFTGSATHRAAELAHSLLLKGFAVVCADGDVRRMAVDGDYEKEHRKWISTVEGMEGILCVRGLYDNLTNARTLPSAKWVSKTGVGVRVEHHAELLDYADIHGFKLTPSAQRAVDKQIAKEAAAWRIAPAELPKAEPKRDKLAEILDTKGDGILDHLKDEPL